MRKAVLIYNPTSGRRREGRVAQVETAGAVFRAAGVEAICVPTRGAGTAGEQAREAICEGCDVVFACGGDGTVHEVLQGVISENPGERCQAALGVIPLGTANALAHDLGIPRDPAAAARAALSATSQRIAVGRMQFLDAAGQDVVRYFAVAAGIGPDAHLFYKLHAGFKQRHGMFAYYTEAMRIWATHQFVPFEVEFCDCKKGIVRREIVSQLLAVRIAQFGGALRNLAPGATLERDDLRLVLFKTASRSCYLAYMLAVMLGRNWKVPGVELVHAHNLQCRPLSAPATAWGQTVVPTASIYAEVDGELVGRIPVSISTVPNALSLLMPKRIP